MAKVTGQVIGGSAKVFENASTVGEIKELMNAKTHTATVNGEPADDSDELNDYDFVSLAPAVKGA